ncbi:hypothetical protein BGY98DRAFT_498516 [Russula aff. rugulosa BPL654]|nr:hypothetical protein BGY98DRAFT_498516 [Russula aff. rugulosa BPL654]
MALNFTNPDATCDGFPPRMCDFKLQVPHKLNCNEEEKGVPIWIAGGARNMCASHDRCSGPPRPNINQTS